VLAVLPEVTLDEADYRLMQNGGFASPDKYSLETACSRLRLKGPGGELFALGSSDTRRIKVDRILHLKG
jgi:hypothetical protein